MLQTLEGENQQLDCIKASETLSILFPSYSLSIYKQLEMNAESILGYLKTYIIAFNPTILFVER